MAKLPTSSEFKLNLPAARGRRVERAVRPEAPKPETTEAAPAKPARTSVPPGAKSLTFYPSKDAWLQLRMLSGRLDRPAQDLLLDALDALFRDHGLPTISRGVPNGEAA